MRFAPLLPKPNPAANRKPKVQRKNSSNFTSTAASFAGRMLDHESGQPLEPVPWFTPVSDAIDDLQDIRRRDQRGDLPTTHLRASDTNASLSRRARAIAHDSLFARGTGILPKLEVGPANDPLEREADAIADRVMRTPDPGGDVVDGLAELDNEDGEDELLETPTFAAFGGDEVSPAAPGVAVRRKCASCEHEEEQIMREADPGQPGGGTASSEFSARVENRLRLGGAPLPAQTRDFLEPRFGIDLSPIRVHTDSEAGRLARQINARAFTLDQDIFFAPNELRPQTRAGMQLLAHEVAHTLQTGPSTVRRAPIIHQCRDHEINDVAALLEAIAEEVLLSFTDSGFALVRTFAEALKFTHPDIHKSVSRKLLEIEAKRRAVRTWGSREASLDLTTDVLSNPQHEYADILEHYVFMHGTKGAPINAHYGPAHGRITLVHSPDGYETLDRKYSCFWLHHDQLPTISQPEEQLGLFLQVENSTVQGMLGGFVWDELPPALAHTVALLTWAWPDTWRQQIGLSGVKVTGPKIEANELRDGQINFDAHIEFETDEGLTGDGELSIDSTTAELHEAELVVEANGLDSAIVPLEWRDDYDVAGYADPEVNYETSAEGKLAYSNGSIHLNYQAGQLSGIGDIDFNYANGAIRGRAVLGLDRREAGFDAIRKEASAHFESVQIESPPGPATSENSPDVALFGFAVADFRLNDWMTGTVMIALDPDGELIAVGAWTPDVEFQFLNPPTHFPEEGPRELFPTLEFDEHSLAGVPLLFDLYFSGSMSAIYQGSLGPGRIHSLAAETMFSTRKGFESLWLSAKSELVGATILTFQITGGLYFRAALMDAASAEFTLYGDVLIAEKLESKLDFSLSEGPKATFAGELDFSAAAWLGLSLTGQVTILGQKLVSEEDQPEPSMVRPDPLIYDGGLTSGNAIGLGSLTARVLVLAELSPGNASLTFDDFELEAAADTLLLEDQEALLTEGLDSVFTQSSEPGPDEAAMPSLDDVRKQSPQVIDIVQIDGAPYFVLRRLPIEVDGEHHHIAIAVTSLDEMHDKLVLLLESSPELLVRRLAAVRDRADVDEADQIEADVLIARIHEYQDSMAGAEQDVDRAEKQLAYSKIEADAEAFLDRAAQSQRDENLEGDEAPAPAEGDPKGDKNLHKKIKAKIKSGKLSFASPRDGSVFWVRPNKDRAESWARRQNPPHTSLEGTRGGTELRDEIADSKLNKEQIDDLWIDASVMFARRVLGSTSLFDTGPHRTDPERAWHKHERPELLRNQNVTYIISRRIDGVEYKREPVHPRDEDERVDESLEALPEGALGQPLPGAKGHNKQAYEYVGRPDYLILRLHKDSPQGRKELERELAVLKSVRDAGIDVPENEGIKLADGIPALVVEKIEGIFSKDVIELDKHKKPKIKNSSLHQQVYNSEAIVGGLNELLEKLKDNGIDDLQFIMHPQGKVYVIDPRNFFSGKAVSANHALIKTLLLAPGSKSKRDKHEKPRGRNQDWGDSDE